MCILEIQKRLQVRQRFYEKITGCKCKVTWLPLRRSNKLYETSKTDILFSIEQDIHINI